MAMYCQASDIRSFTNVPSSEFNDTALGIMISGAVDEIDRRTGRTWQGIATQTYEYYDGDGTNYLHLNQQNIQSITYLGIDNTKTEVYTEISSSNPTMYFWYSEGLVTLNTVSSTISTFPVGTKNVKISYTYGNSTVPDSIKLLNIMMVADILNPDASRKTWIERKVKELKAIGANLTS